MFCETKPNLRGGVGCWVCLCKTGGGCRAPVDERERGFAKQSQIAGVVGLLLKKTFSHDKWDEWDEQASCSPASRAGSEVHARFVCAKPGGGCLVPRTYIQLSKILAAEPLARMPPAASLMEFCETEPIPASGPLYAALTSGISVAGGVDCSFWVILS